MALLIEDYLRVLPNYTFPDRIIQKAMGAYKIAEHTPAFSIDERSRDLAEAIMWDAAAGIVNGGAQRKQIGNRSITTAALQTSQQDRAAWQAKAKALRAKWNAEVPTVEILQISDFTELW